jgi:hypothetical protein
MSSIKSKDIKIDNNLIIRDFIPLIVFPLTTPMKSIFNLSLKINKTNHPNP